MKCTTRIMVAKTINLKKKNNFTMKHLLLFFTKITSQPQYLFHVWENEKIEQKFDISFLTYREFVMIPFVRLIIIIFQTTFFAVRREQPQEKSTHKNWNLVTKTTSYGIICTRSLPEIIMYLNIHTMLGNILSKRQKLIENLKTNRSVTLGSDC